MSTHQTTPLIIVRPHESFEGIDENNHHEMTGADAPVKTCDWHLCRKVINSAKSKTRFCCPAHRTRYYYDKRIQQEAIQYALDNPSDITRAAIERAIDDATAPLLTQIRSLQHRISLIAQTARPLQTISEVRTNG